MPGPLDGIKVIDLTSMISGPLTTMILADQGADVIKIENPNGGDFTRSASNKQNGFSASFLNNNRNKKSVTINLKTEKGLQILKKLTEDADVFVQNFRPGVIERMGLGEDSIRDAAPDIIYVSISGFGHEGPYAGKPVYDPLVQAMSGLTTIQGGSDEQRPRLVRTILPDKLTGFTCAQAITSALFHRLRTGEGQHVRLSMLDSVISFLWSSDMASQTFVGNEFAQEKAQSFIDLIYETADGYISVAVQSDKEWLGLTKALNRPEWLEDNRFKTPALRQINIDDRLNLTQKELRSRISAEWIERLEAEDVPCAPVLRRRDVVSHSQIRANQTVVEVAHKDVGKLRQARPAARFSRTNMESHSGAPGLGEHTDEVLSEIGLSNDEITLLRSDGIIGSKEQETSV